MRLHYLVTVDIDPARLADDRPPEPIVDAMHSELASHLDSVTQVFGMQGYEVQFVGSVEP